MRHSDSLAKLAPDLVKAYGELKNPGLDETAKVEGKDGKKGYSYDYVSLATVLDLLRPVLARHHLALLQAPGTGAKGPALHSLLLHTSGEWIEPDPLELPVMKADPQAWGSAITYARRYVALALTCVVGDKDDDAQAATAPASKPITKIQSAVLKFQRQMVDAGLCRKGDVVRHLLAVFELECGPMAEWPALMFDEVNAECQRYKVGQTELAAKSKGAAPPTVTMPAAAMPRPGQPARAN